MVIEQLSFRAAVVRIDDSVFLRRFIEVLPSASADSVGDRNLAYFVAQ